MTTPEKIPGWKIELINAYVDDVENIPVDDLFEMAKARDNEAAEQLKLSVELLELTEA